MTAVRWLAALLLAATAGVPVAPAGRPPGLPSGLFAELAPSGPSPAGARLLVRTGDRAPGEDTFVEFSDPATNTRGDLVFGALTAPPRAREAVYLLAGGRLTMLAASGQPAPTGGAFVTFSDLLLNNRGTVGFLAQTTGRTATEGMYVLRAGRAVPIVSTGDRAPSGGAFTDFANPTINDHDIIAFVGRTGGREGILVNVEGSTTQVVMSGQPAPDGGAFEFFLDGSPALNDRGQIAFVASTTPHHAQGIYTLVGGRPVTVVTTGGDAPLGGRFTEFGSLALTNAGTVGFIGRTDSRTLPEALYVTGRAILVPVAVSGEPVPGGALTKFANVAINNSEDVVFQLSLPVIPLGVYAATRAGVRPLVRAGDPAPGGGRFVAFSTPSLNDLGQVAFVAETDDGRHGIYLVSTR
jgi:hypothetical protein